MKRSLTLILALLMTLFALTPAMAELHQQQQESQVPEPCHPVDPESYYSNTPGALTVYKSDDLGNPVEGATVEVRATTSLAYVTLKVDQLVQMGENMLKQEFLASGQQPEDWKDLFDSSDPDEAFMVVIRTTAPGGYIINPQNLEGPDGRLNTFGIVSLAIDSDMDTVLLAPGTYSLTAYGPDKSKKIFTSDAIGWNQLLYQRSNVLFTVNNGIQVTEQNVEAWHYSIRPIVTW